MNATRQPGLNGVAMTGGLPLDFFHVPLPRWALRPRDAAVNLDAVVPSG